MKRSSLRRRASSPALIVVAARFARRWGARGSRGRIVVAAGCGNIVAGGADGRLQGRRVFDRRRRRRCRRAASAGAGRLQGGYGSERRPVRPSPRSRVEPGGADGRRRRPQRAARRRRPGQPAHPALQGRQARRHHRHRRRHRAGHRLRPRRQAARARPARRRQRAGLRRRRQAGERSVASPARASPKAAASPASSPTTTASTSRTTTTRWCASPTPAGAADPNRPALVGRPSRDGRSLLAAEIADAAAGDRHRQRRRSQHRPAGVEAVDPARRRRSCTSSRSTPTPTASSTSPSTSAARSPAPASSSTRRILLLRLGSGGAPRGLLAVPPCRPPTSRSARSRSVTMAASTSWLPVTGVSP